MLKAAAGIFLLCLFASFSISKQQNAEVRNASLAPSAAASAASSADEDAAEAESEAAAAFRTTLRNLFNEQKFAQLEEIASDVRSQRSRFPGGAWKLHSFYGALNTPGSLTSTDAAWNAHMERLEKWIVFKPDSSTPRLALAESYLRFAWKARGSGTGDKVTPEAWKLFGERVQKAREILELAKAASSKDPQWYRAMQTVALAQGWDQKQAEQLLAEADTTEPTYYYVYESYANYLLPKWYGKPGDAEKFVQTAADRVGGQEGDAIYFQVALTLNCCRRPQAPGLDWDRVKKGFASLEQLYHSTNYQRNALAFMAVRAGDRDFAQQLFQRIGDDWSQRVWGSKDKFESSKAAREIIEH